jgi:hypothetical protein
MILRRLPLAAGATVPRCPGTAGPGADSLPYPGLSCCIIMAFTVPAVHAQAGYRLAAAPDGQRDRP